MVDIKELLRDYPSLEEAAGRMLNAANSWICGLRVKDDVRVRAEALANLALRLKLDTMIGKDPDRQEFFAQIRGLRTLGVDTNALNVALATASQPPPKRPSFTHRLSRRYHD